MQLNNIINHNTIFLLDGINNGFAMLVDFLKICESRILKNNNPTEVKIETSDDFTDNILESFIALDKVLSIYKFKLNDNELMKREIFSISEIQDMLNYFINEDKIKFLSNKEYLFIIWILEEYKKFISNKIRIMNDEYLNNEEKFLIEYEKIFNQYDEIFEKQNEIFYLHFFSSNKNYDEAINETFKILGNEVKIQKY
ncbi:MAG: hypothetical protein LBM96_01630 [Methanobrevibacter sp.]|jgi:hypothetical protein|nr:hypothetical protein [Candidatus Methanoflexus mossambicus]